MSGDWIAAMDSFIRSASEGPPISAWSAWASRPPLDCWASFSRLAGEAGVGLELELELREGEVFSIPHLRRRFNPGSMVKVYG